MDEAPLRADAIQEACASRLRVRGFPSLASASRSMAAGVKIARYRALMYSLYGSSFEPRWGDWKGVGAWCLMRNHFHLAVETPLGNLVAGMKWFLGAYTIRFNARHRLRGHLFAGRYKSVIVDDGDPH